MLSVIYPIFQPFKSHPPLALSILFYMRLILRSMQVPVRCIVLTIMCLYTSVFARPVRALETDAAYILLDSPDSPVHKWMGISIQELSKIGTDRVNNPDSLEKAIETFTAIVGRYEGGGVPDADLHAVVSAMNNLGYVYTFHFLDYQKGIRYLNTGLEIAEAKGIKDVIPVICLNLGAIYTLNQTQYSGISFPEKSVKVYTKGLQVAWETKDWENYFKLINNLLNVQALLPQKMLPEEILDGFSECTKYAGRHIMYPFTLLHVRAYEAIRHKDYDRALSLYAEMEKKTTGFQDAVRYRLMAMSEKVLVLEMKSDYKTATTEIDKALQVALSHGCDDIALSLYDDARRLYADMGDKEKAEHYYVQYLKQKDSIFDACRMKAVGEIQFRHDMDKMEHTVRDLSYHKQIQKVWLWALGFLSLLAILFAVYYNYSNRRLRQRNQSLYQKNLTNIETENRNFSLKKENDELRSELAVLREKPCGAEPHDKQNKYSYSILDDDRKNAIRQKMDAVIEEDRNIFNQDFSLAMLAEKVGCPQTYLSQVISEKTGKNFYTILSERRIKEACRMMSNPDYIHLTIEGVASEVGIRSRSNFTSLFKKFTGLTPGEFARQSRESGHKAGDK